MIAIIFWSITRERTRWRAERRHWRRTARDWSVSDEGAGSGVVVVVVVVAAAAVGGAPQAGVEVELAIEAAPDDLERLHAVVLAAPAGHQRVDALQQPVDVVDAGLLHEHQTQRLDEPRALALLAVRHVTCRRR